MNHERQSSFLARLRAYWAQVRLLGQALQKWSPGRRLRARRQLAWEVLRSQAEAVTFERAGIRWHANTSDTVAEGLFVAGRFQLEPLEELLAWLGHRRPEVAARPLLVNIGANIGAACIPLTLRTSKRCVAGEPVPETFAQLRHNVALNNLTGRIACHGVAIAIVPGTLEMVVSRDSGQSEVRTATGRQGHLSFKSGGRIVNVPCLPLDQLVSEAGWKPADVALVWSDTQGFETNVIASGGALWRAGTPLWVEVWPQGLEIHGGVRQFMTVCEQFFGGFILNETLLRHKEAANPQPIGDLPTLIASLATGKRRHRQLETDILLLPRIG